MGKWATYRKRGASPDLTPPIPPPAIMDFACSIEFEDPLYVLYGQQLEEGPIEATHRQYRWRETGVSEWTLGGILPLIDEAILDPSVPNVLHYYQMRWMGAEGLARPGMWSVERYFPGG